MVLDDPILARCPGADRVLHGVDQMGEVGAEAVELPDDEHVVLPQDAQTAVEFRSSRRPEAKSW